MIADDEEEEEEKESQAAQYKLAVKPQFTHINIAKVADLYFLPDLQEKIAQFLYDNQSQSTHQNTMLPSEWDLLDIWTSVKICELPIVSTDNDQPGMRKIFARLHTKKTMCLISRQFLLIQHQIHGKIVMLDWLVSCFSDIFCCYILTESRASHCSTSLDFSQGKSPKR